MLTYVINTSENKTLDSGVLFDLAAYSKIRWLTVPLNAVRKCAEEISAKQGVLGAERFRVAVIVDFYNFDRIRVPYGRRGYVPDDGVDMSLYMPYIEAYLLDNLVVCLENRNLYAADFEIYYVQHDRCEHYDVFHNAADQLTRVMSGGTPGAAPTTQQAESAEEDYSAEILLAKEHVKDLEQGTGRKKGTKKDQTEDALESSGEGQEHCPSNEVYYKNFMLHCTPSVSLNFDLMSYPYGAEAMTLTQFWHAFRLRQTNATDIRRHYYVVSYGEGSSKVALDLLSLSLHLVRLYEREEQGTPDGDMDVLRLDSEALRDVLESSWNKVNVAKSTAKKNNSSYYSLAQYCKSTTQLPVTNGAEKEPEISPGEAIARELTALAVEGKHEKFSADYMYTQIVDIVDCAPGKLEAKNRSEFDSIMKKYLKKRDETKEANVEKELESAIESGDLAIADHCPSEEEYAHLVKTREQEVSALFGRALRAGYIDVNYAEEKKEATEAYEEYRKIKARMSRNIFIDIICMLLAVVVAVVPYWMLQLNHYAIQAIQSYFSLTFVASVFVGLGILALVLQFVPLARKLKEAQRRIRECYLDCRAKERYSFSAIRRRYEQDLVAIEYARYDLRQLKYLHHANQAKERLITEHQETLERLEDCLSSILNHLDIEPTLNLNECIDGALDLTKPVRARENRIYQVFSVETIEKVFPTGKDVTDT